MRNRSGFTQSTDEVPIFASNQIVKDLCGHQRTSCDTRGTTGLETCFASRRAKIHARRPTEKLRILERTTRKAVFRPTRWLVPGFVTFPYEDLSVLYHRRSVSDNCCPLPRCEIQIFLAARLEYQKPSPCATASSRFSSRMSPRAGMLRA